VAWLTETVNAIGLALAPLLFLLFPTGRLPSARWTPVARLVVASALLNGVTTAMRPGLFGAFPTLANPAGLIGSVGAVVNGLALGGSVLSGFLFLAAAASLLARWRRARGVERQQLKWFAYDGALMAILFGALLVAPALGVDLTNGPFGVNVNGLPLWPIAVAGMPATIGIAILRYRLYDIDLIIRRTVVYGALTLSLATVYVGSVVLLQRVFHAVSGQQSDLAIVGSTLVIAALFQPLRRGIQRGFDRRFYRRKYDAAKVLAAFGSAARDEVELDRLTRRLLAVVDDTMQPAQLRLWLRPPAGRKGDV
jgi:hypothetical protein